MSLHILLRHKVERLFVNVTENLISNVQRLILLKLTTIIDPKYMIELKDHQIQYHQFPQQTTISNYDQHL